jgi:hypothetical protein
MRLPRLEAAGKISGAAKFTDDLARPFSNKITIWSSHQSINRVQSKRLLCITKGEEGCEASRITATKEIKLEAQETGRTEISCAPEVSIVGRLGKFGIGIMKNRATQLASEFAGAVQQMMLTADRRRRRLRGSWPPDVASPGYNPARRRRIRRKDGGDRARDKTAVAHGPGAHPDLCRMPAAHHCALKLIDIEYDELPAVLRMAPCNRSKT